MKRNLFFIFISIFFLSGCLLGHVDRRGQVSGYKKGMVQTEGGSFQVGRLPPPWQQKKTKLRAILFSHPTLQASIHVDSFCKGSFDDADLPMLASQLFYSIKNQRLVFQKNLKLDERDAYRRVIRGELDGASVQLDVVVLKKNECVFDFVYTSIPKDYVWGVRDFEFFFTGFRYIKGP